MFSKGKDKRPEHDFASQPDQPDQQDHTSASSPTEGHIKGLSQEQFDSFDASLGEIHIKFARGSTAIISRLDGVPAPQLCEALRTIENSCGLRTPNLSSILMAANLNSLLEELMSDVLGARSSESTEDPEKQP